MPRREFPHRTSDEGVRGPRVPAGARLHVVYIMTPDVVAGQQAVLSLRRCKFRIFGALIRPAERDSGLLARRPQSSRHMDVLHARVKPSASLSDK